MTEVAAMLATGILSLLCVLQILLAVGVPIGKFAWGGQYTVLPKKLRIASAFSVLLYSFFALLILNQAGIVEIFDTKGWASVVFWIVTAYFFVGIIMNAISRSKPERAVMTPVAAALAGLFLYIALTS